MQYEAEQDEIFLGMSKAERAAYNARAKRINELEIELNATAITTEQQRQWGKAPETDTPQAEARQPYRDREKQSSEPHDETGTVWEKAISAKDRDE